jgi:hypothetical protein
MANFIKVGDRFINLDLVTDVQIDKQRIAKLGRIAIAITLNVPEPKGVGASDWFVEARTIVLDGEEAQAVLEWLDLGAIDVVQQYRERAERDNPERFA